MLCYLVALYMIAIAEDCSLFVQNINILYEDYVFCDYTISVTLFGEFAVSGGGKLLCESTYCGKHCHQH